MDSKDPPTDPEKTVEEKGATEHEHTVSTADIDTSNTSDVDERQLIRRVDWRLVPWFSLLYLLSFLDRTSIGNAKLYGLEADLRISDNQYLVSLTVFFISYSIFEVPSNIFLKRMRPSVWFAFLMTMWGLMMMLQGFAHNFGGLVGLRWMLGMFEAGLYRMAYHLSCWYKRSELGIRTALFTSATTLSGAFGGLLAAAISNMHGVGGKTAWSWIFILEGLATIAAGVASYWVVQDFPEDAKFLTEKERAFMIRRLQGDDQFSAAGEKLEMRNILASFRDWKTWFGMAQLMGCDMPLYAFSLFTPSVINQLGFSATPANLLTVPIYAFAAIVTCCVAYYSDKHGRRGYCNIVMLSIGAIGYIILAVSRNAKLSYIAIYIASCGIFPVVPNTVTWVANNFEGTYKRGVSLALGISMGNLNGAVSSNVYRAKDRPWYPLGHGLVLMYICIAIIANALFLYLLKQENARRDRGERDEVIGPEGLVDNGNGRYATVEDAKREKGDNWSGYRYIL
ncbi:MFS general substrate transporter [Mycena belliarum]|uniref:MFS general substrate transporter n=1 Tax=Mycena belliarum TaxID=1033014 RepID=A0AAD6U632_9AGAR|nr:MFS general substrate transporter [Mycena belliae]